MFWIRICIFQNNATPKNNQQSWVFGQLFPVSLAFSTSLDRCYFVSVFFNDTEDATASMHIFGELLTFDSCGSIRNSKHHEAQQMVSGVQLKPCHQVKSTSVWIRRNLPKRKGSLGLATCLFFCTHRFVAYIRTHTKAVNGS